MLTTVFLVLFPQLLGASSAKQLETNLLDIEKGPLPQTVQDEYVSIPLSSVRAVTMTTGLTPSPSALAQT